MKHYENHENYFAQTLSTRYVAALAIITLWGVSIRAAQAGYTVTLQKVGIDVVATGSGAIDLNGLTFPQMTTRYAGGFPTGGGPLHPAFINTGPISSNVDMYFSLTGPTSFGSGGFTYASSGSGDMVEILAHHIFATQAQCSNGLCLWDRFRAR